MVKIAPTKSCSSLKTPPPVLPPSTLAPQHTELLFQRYQSSFIHTLDVGRQLFSMGDEEIQTQLQTDLGTLQEEWDNLHSLLGRRMDLTEAIVKVVVLSLSGSCSSLWILNIFCLGFILNWPYLDLVWTQTPTPWSWFVAWNQNLMICSCFHPHKCEAFSALCL